MIRPELDKWSRMIRENSSNSCQKRKIFLKINGLTMYSFSNFKFLSVLAVTATLFACDNTPPDPCGTPKPETPIAATASAQAQQIRKDLNGKWQWVSLKTGYRTTGKDTTHTAGSERRYLCFAQNGGLRTFWKDEEKCAFNYHLVDGKSGVEVQFNNGGNEWCSYQLHNGGIEVRHDSIIIKMDDGVTTKMSVFRRIDAEGHLK
jgi:glucose/arabinose dehydrogenase